MTSRLFCRLEYDVMTDLDTEEYDIMSDLDTEKYDVKTSLYAKKYEHMMTDLDTEAQDEIIPVGCDVSQPLLPRTK